VSQASGALIAYNTSNNTVGTSIQVGVGINAVALTPDSRTAFVTNPVKGTVTPVDLATGTLGTAIPVASSTSPNAIAITGQGAADLSLTQTAAPAGAFGLGSGNLTYTLTVGTAGPNLATGIVLTDTLPAGVTFVSASTNQGFCDQSGASTVTCILGGLAN